MYYLLSYTVIIYWWNYRLISLGTICMQIYVTHAIEYYLLYYPREDCSEILSCFFCCNKMNLTDLRAVPKAFIISKCLYCQTVNVNWINIFWYRLCCSKSKLTRAIRSRSNGAITGNIGFIQWKQLKVV